MYVKFQSGFHSLRHTDRYWAGLLTDLVIEQVLIQSLKTIGGHDITVISDHRNW